MYPGKILTYLAQLEAALETMPVDAVPDGVTYSLTVKWEGDHVASLYEEGWNFDRPKEDSRTTDNSTRAAQADAWEEACQAFGWCLNNGSIEDALAYVSEHNPYAKDQT